MHSRFARGGLFKEIDMPAVWERMFHPARNNPRRPGPSYLIAFANLRACALSSSAKVENAALREGSRARPARAW